MKRIDSVPDARVDIAFDRSTQLLACRFAGLITPDDLDRMARAIAQAGQPHTVHGLLLDARASTPAYSLEDLSGALERCLEDVAPKRCAFVMQPMDADRTRQARVIETTSLAFAVRARSFHEEAAARDWLLAR